MQSVFEWNFDRFQTTHAQNLLASDDLSGQQIYKLSYAKGAVMIAQKVKDSNQNITYRFFETARDHKSWFKRNAESDKSWKDLPIGHPRLCVIENVIDDGLMTKEIKPWEYASSISSAQPEQITTNLLKLADYGDQKSLNIIDALEHNGFINPYCPIRNNIEDRVLKGMYKLEIPQDLAAYAEGGSKGMKNMKILVFPYVRRNYKMDKDTNQKVEQPMRFGSGYVLLHSSKQPIEAMQPKELQYFAGSPSMGRQLTCYAIDLSIYGNVKTFARVVGYNIVHFSGNFVKKVARLFLAGSTGMLKLMPGTVVSESSDYRALDEEGNWKQVKVDLNIGTEFKVEQATYYFLKHPSDANREIVVLSLPDGVAHLPNQTIYVNASEDNRGEGELESKGLFKIAKDIKNNYTDGTGIMKESFQKEYMPQFDFKRAKTGLVRLGSVVKGLDSIIPDEQMKAWTKHDLVPDGADLVIGGGQGKSNPALEHDMKVGFFYLTTLMNVGPRTQANNHIGPIGLQYMAEEYENKQLLDNLVKHSSRIYSRIVSNFDDNIHSDVDALVTYFLSRLESQTEEDHEVVEKKLTSPEKLLAEAVVRCGGNLDHPALASYRNKVAALLKNTIGKLANTEFFLAEGVLDYYWSPDLNLWFESFQKGRNVITKEWAISEGIEFVDTDQIVFQTKALINGYYRSYQFVGPVSVIRYPCSSRLSVRLLQAVHSNFYRKLFKDGYLHGLQIRSAFDLNASCQDGGDFDGDRCKIILNPELHFLAKNNEAKIDGWIRFIDGKPEKDEDGNIVVKDACPYYVNDSSDNPWADLKDPDEEQQLLAALQGTFNVMVESGIGMATNNAQAIKAAISVINTDWMPSLLSGLAYLKQNK